MGCACYRRALCGGGDGFCADAIVAAEVKYADAARGGFSEGDGCGYLRADTEFVGECVLACGEIGVVDFDLPCTAVVHKARGQCFAYHCGVWPVSSCWVGLPVDGVVGTQIWCDCACRALRQGHSIWVNHYATWVGGALC